MVSHFRVEQGIAHFLGQSLLTKGSGKENRAVNDDRQVIINQLFVRYQQLSILLMYLF